MRVRGYTLFTDFKEDKKILIKGHTLDTDFKEKVLTNKANKSPLRQHICSQVNVPGGPSFQTWFYNDEAEKSAPANDAKHEKPEAKTNCVIL